MTIVSTFLLWLTYYIMYIALNVLVHLFADTQKSLILQILSQLRIGMDLTRFALPVTILEKRSLLEMYAEFFAHPDILTR